MSVTSIFNQLSQEGETNFVHKFPETCNFSCELQTGIRISYSANICPCKQKFLAANFRSTQIKKPVLQRRIKRKIVRKVFFFGILFKKSLYEKFKFLYLKKPFGLSEAKN